MGYACIVRTLKGVSSKMGNRSAFMNESIKVIDIEFFSILDTLISEVCSYFPIITDNFLNTVSFVGLDDYKIEGYWYPEFKKALDIIAKAIEGWVEFMYEEEYRYRIVFKNKTWYFQREPSIDWDKCPLFKRAGV